MEGEFTNFCKHYYELQLQLEQVEARFKTLLKNAPPYTGQTCVAELDAIISYNRRVQKARDTSLECAAAKERTGHIIKQILAYFEIPPHTMLTCEIPGQYELTIWDDELWLNCIKTKQLAPLEESGNIISIPLIGKRYNSVDEEES